MVKLMSHGFKYGKPEANFIFDVSFFRNPWREKELRDAGKEEILAFMEKQTEFIGIIDSLANLIQCYSNCYPDENLVFAFCCSAGEYRSPVVVESLSKRLFNMGVRLEVIHNPLSKLV